MNVVQAYRPIHHEEVWRIDECFYNAMLALRCKMLWKFLYSFSKSLLLIFFLIYYYTQHPHDHYFSTFIAQSIFTILYTYIYLAFLIHTHNIQQSIIIARLTFHAVMFAERQHVQVKSIEDCVINGVYCLPEREQGEPPEVEKRKMEATLQDVIESCYGSQHIWLFIGGGMVEVGRVVLAFVFLGKAWNDGGLEGVMKVVVIGIIVTEIIANLRMITQLVLAVLSPLLFFVVCFIVMCCYREPRIVIGEPNYVLENEAIEYRPSMRLEGDHECSICFQNFRESDRIVVLPCDSKHTFHAFCLRTWFTVSRTCPLCRTAIP